jgi:hypothetical protein
MDDPVVSAAQIAFSVRLKDSSDVSENTKNAQAIAKAWRGAVHTLDPDRFQIEALVTPELDQKIDIVDTDTACAYEFKVSGKNAPAEFYKDIVKVIIWNEKRKKKLSSFSFHHGRKTRSAIPRCADAASLHEVSGGTRLKSGCGVCPARLRGSSFSGACRFRCDYPADTIKR